MVYIDGDYFDRDSAKVSVFDHGLLYGDGVFEGLRIYDGSIFRFGEHMDRLFESAKALSLDIPLSREKLEEAVLKTVEINEKKEGYIRLIVTRGKGNLGLDPDSCEIPTVIIIVDDLQIYPERFYLDGLEIILVSTRQFSPDCLDARIKSLNYLNNIMAKIQAKVAGCQEAVMLNSEGYISECTADNIFIVKGEKIKTPSSVSGALDGITKRVVMDIAEGVGVLTEETALTSFDLYTADEVFLTGTGAEIVPVVRVDGRVIGDGTPGPVTCRLMRSFSMCAEGGGRPIHPDMEE